MKWIPLLLPLKQNYAKLKGRYTWIFMSYEFNTTLLILTRNPWYSSQIERGNSESGDLINYYTSEFPIEIKALPSWETWRQAENSFPGNLFPEEHLWETSHFSMASFSLSVSSLFPWLPVSSWPVPPFGPGPPGGGLTGFCELVSCVAGGGGGGEGAGGSWCRVLSACCPASEDCSDFFEVSSFGRLPVEPVGAGASCRDPNSLWIRIPFYLFTRTPI